MQWSDRAIILNVRRLGESSGLIHLLTPGHGMYAGVDRGAFSKAKRGIYQPGNVVSAHWNARLSEQVGSLNCELTDSIAAHVLDDRKRLAALTSAMLMAHKILVERDKQAHVFERMESFATALREDAGWLQAYVLLEYALLEHAGFGLDLETCAATGQSHDLLYVSPKSGRAVSRFAGKPYHERLFRLPAFLSAFLPEKGQFHAPDLAQILDGVRLCGYFLEARVFAPKGHQLPAARMRFIEMLQLKDSFVGEAAQ